MLIFYYYTDNRNENVQTTTLYRCVYRWNRMIIRPYTVGHGSVHVVMLVCLHLSNTDLYNSVPIPYGVTVILAKVQRSLTVQLNSYDPM